MRTYRRRTFACFALCALALALAGCASHPRRGRSAQPTPDANAPGQSAAPTAPRTGTAPNQQLPPAPGGMVGVASCDQYLSTYKACHRAAGIFAPDQLDAHYDLMRGTLLRDARDPLKRAVLDQRCRALSRQLRQALHGRSCYPAPPTAPGGND